jgi:hypothetical protein
MLKTKAYLGIHYLVPSIGFWSHLSLYIYTVKHFYTHTGNISIYKTSSLVSSKPCTVFTFHFPTCILLCIKIYLNLLIISSRYGWLFSYTQFLHLYESIYYPKIVLAISFTYFSKTSINFVKVKFIGHTIEVSHRRHTGYVGMWTVYLCA